MAGKNGQTKFSPELKPQVQPHVREDQTVRLWGYYQNLTVLLNNGQKMRFRQNTLIVSAFCFRELRSDSSFGHDYHEAEWELLFPLVDVIAEKLMGNITVVNVQPFLRNCIHEHPPLHVLDKTVLKDGPEPCIKVVVGFERHELGKLVTTHPLSL